MKREDVEALRARVLREADNAAGRGVRLADMTFSVEGDTLVALCRRWLEVTHCDNCGCDWLDNGLNPIGCPYCKESPAVGEEIMVNAAHGVFTLPLQPSGLSSGPRFVVHVPPPEQPAAPSNAREWVLVPRELLGEARNIAMEWTLKGRVPECGKFGQIAQDLDAMLAAAQPPAAPEPGEGNNG